jgi:hypothetical protein
MVEPFQKCPAGALSQAALISPVTFGRAMPHPHAIGPELFYHLDRAEQPESEPAGREVPEPAAGLHLSAFGT